MKYNELNFLRKTLGLIYGVFLLFFPSKRMKKLPLIITLAGIIMRLWAAGIIRKNKRLSIRGPYSICRNPLYFGSFLVGLGLSLSLLPFVLALLFPVIFLSIYIPKMKQEEEDLEEIFGNEFLKYKRDVNLFCPSFKSFESSEFSMKQAIKNKEYNISLGVIAIFVLRRFRTLLIWNKEQG